MQPFSDKTTVAVPDDRGRAERLAAVLDRYMCELENGGIPPDVDALVAAHPDLADELRSYVDSLKLLAEGLAARGINTGPLPLMAAGTVVGLLAGNHVFEQLRALIL